MTIYLIPLLETFGNSHNLTTPMETTISQYPWEEISLEQAFDFSITHRTSRTSLDEEPKLCELLDMDAGDADDGTWTMDDDANNVG